MEINKLIRKNILELKPYTSARDIHNSSEGILLDANENSWGSSFDEIGELKLNRYPDPHQKDLRKIVGDYYSIHENNLFFGVGSDEIIDLLIRIFCEPGQDSIIIPGPTYGMYQVCAEINNVNIKSPLLRDDFQIDLDEIEKNYHEKVKIIFLCSPNNPTGGLLIKKDIFSLCKKYESIIVVDEAYIDFAEKGSVINEIKNYTNLVVLRTFSKAWGLAGIRLGFCSADEQIINCLFKIKAPYNINSLTKYALEKAIKNSAKKDEYVKAIIKERDRLKHQLEVLPGIINVYDSDANYLLIKCADPKDVQKKLSEKGIIIRDRSTQPKLEGCLRISVGTEEENDILWEQIKKLLS
jgi:histidinol-phosphate aminotransferase